MTKELREPPLLGDNPFYIDSARKAYEQGKQDQRDADIKWMKEHCYLKAERGLPPSLTDRIPLLKAMLDEVGFRACEKFKDD